MHYSVLKTEEMTTYEYPEYTVFLTEKGENKREVTFGGQSYYVSEILTEVL